MYHPASPPPFSSCYKHPAETVVAHTGGKIEEDGPEQYIQFHGNPRYEAYVDERCLRMYTKLVVPVAYLRMYKEQHALCCDIETP